MQRNEAVDLKQLDPNYLNRLADILLGLLQKRYRCWTFDAVMDVLVHENHPLNRDPGFLKDLNKAIQQFRDELPQLDRLLSGSRAKSVRDFPPIWIKSNKGIMRNLNKKGNRHFLPVYEILRDSYIRQGDKGTPVLVLPDYASIENKTGLKRKYAYRYIREMCRWGILRRDHVDGERGPMVYSHGVWMPGKGKTPRHSCPK
jgi:hypothetical protein